MGNCNDSGGYKTPEESVRGIRLGSKPVGVDWCLHGRVAYICSSTLLSIGHDNCSQSTKVLAGVDRGSRGKEQKL